MVALVKKSISHHAEGMKCFGLAILGFLVGFAAAPLAQQSIYNPITGLMSSPTIPTVPGFGAAFDPGTASLLERQMIQGTGSFGYYDYSGALFNMPDVYNQFIQRDVDSSLGVSLMVQNMVMPQTAALFGQMNTFGAERYQNFLASYPITEQQKDARDQYLQSCMNQIRFTLGGNNQSPGQLNALAAETCLQRYSDQSRQIQAQSEQTFAEFVRESQDVNAMLAPLMCPTNEAGEILPCWPNMLLKQVRLCALNKLDASGQPEVCDSNNFGVQPAPVSTQALLDIIVKTVGDTYLPEIINPFMRQLAIVDGATLQNVAVRARSEMSNLPPSPPNVPATIVDFQTNYLQCTNSNPMAGMRTLGQVVYDDVFGGNNDGGTQLPNGGTLAQERQRSLILGETSSLQFLQATTDLLAPLTGLAGQERSSLENTLSSAMFTSVGCAANRDIPFLDPLTIVTMRNNCSPDDLQSYFKLAAMDVANVAARNMYLYTRQQLQEALGRLESYDPVAFPMNGTDQPINSPAVQAKLARAIRSIMLPQIELDLKRIENLQTLAQKSIVRTATQGIYKSGGGCLSTYSTTRAGP